MLAIFIGSIGIAISLIPILLSTSQTHRHLRESTIYAAHYTEGGFAICMVCLCLWPILRQKDLIRREYVWFPCRYTWTNCQGINTRTPRLQIIIFGLGGIAFVVCTIIEKATHCQVFHAINNCGILLYLISYIIVMYKYNGAYLANKTVFHYGIALLLGTNLWAWILTTAYPFYDLSRSDITNFSDIINSSQDFYPDSHLNRSVNVASILEISATLFQPFLVEFLTISAGCLLALWQTMRYDPRSMSTNRRLCRRVQEIVDARYENILRGDQEQRQQQSTQNTLSNKRSTFFVAALSVLIAGSYLISAEMLSAGPLSYISENFEDTIRVSFRKIIQTAVHTPLLFMNIYSLRKLRKDSTIMPFQPSLTSSGYLLLFTSGAHFIYCVWRLAANIILLGYPQELGVCINLFYIFSTVTTTTAIWIQTQHLITINYIHRSGRRIPRIIKLILIYLIAINLSEWMYLSLSHKWVEHSQNSVALSPEISIFFGHYNTKLLILLSNPILEIYLFHSAMMACESLHDVSE